MMFILMLYSCEFSLFRAGQVNQLEFTDCNLFEISFIDRFYCYCEDHMRSATCLIYIVWSHYFVLNTILIEFKHLGFIFTFKYIQIFNLKLILFVPSYSKALWFFNINLRFIQQVENLFIVNLQEWAKDCEMLLVCLLFGLIKHVFDHSRYYSQLFLILAC